MEGDSCVRQQGAQGRGLRNRPAVSSPPSLFQSLSSSPVCFPPFFHGYTTQMAVILEHRLVPVSWLNWITVLTYCLSGEPALTPFSAFYQLSVFGPCYTLFFSYLKLDDDNSIFLTILFQGFSGSWYGKLLEQYLVHWRYCTHNCPLPPKKKKPFLYFAVVLCKAFINYVLLRI